MRTQATRKQILDGTLTGSSFNSNFNFYNEMTDYVIGNKVFWQLITYECISPVTGVLEGDLTNSPNISVNWKAITPVMYNAYPSTIQTFTTSRVDILIDTERSPSDAFSTNIATGEITCLIAGNYVLSITASYQINGTSTQRSGSNTFLQIDNGGGYVDLPSFKISGYHRQDNTDEDTGSMNVSFAIASGDKLKMQAIRYIGAAILETIPSGISFLIFNTGGGSKGERGDAGPIGGVGPSGDLVWLGAYDNATTYNIRDTIEYQGSSYTCITNGTVGDPPASINWDLIAKKGTDGAGATVVVQDSSAALPNTPHGTFNFTGDIVATDAGSGVVDVDVTIPVITIPKNTYTYPIWAEENAALASGQYEWAYGNGATTPNDGGITISVDPLYVAKVVSMSLRIGSGTATVELVHNGVLQGINCNVEVSTGQGATNRSFTPVDIADGDYLNFMTSAAAGTTGPCVVTAWIQCTEI